MTPLEFFMSTCIYVCVCVCIYFLENYLMPYNGEGDGTLLQYSCLENPRDGGAWWAAIYGVAQSRTRLQPLSSSGGSTVPLAVVITRVHTSSLERIRLLPGRLHSWSNVSLLPWLSGPGRHQSGLCICKSISLLLLLSLHM